MANKIFLILLIHISIISQNLTLSLIDLPEGDDILITGEAELISWEETDIQNINIEFSSDNGVTWHSVSSDISPSPTSYEWTVPFTVTDQAKIKISASNDESIFDESSSVFRIVNSNTVGGPFASDDHTVVLMHFNNNLENKSKLTDDAIGNDYYINYGPGVDGNFGSAVKLDSPIEIPHNEYLDLTGDWTIEAWIKLDDYSNNPPFIVTKPGDNDAYFANYSLQINSYWEDILFGFYFNENDERVGIRGMKPSLNQWNHVTFIRDIEKSELKLVVKDIDNNIIFSKTADDKSTPVLTNIQNLVIGDGLNGYIDELRISNVARDYLTLTAPNAGDSLKAGSNYHIKWISEGVDQVKLEYRESNLSQWQLIKDQVSADKGVYLWAVPDITANQCQVRISSSSDPSVYDISDGTFSIGVFKSNILARENLLMHYYKEDSASAESIADRLQEKLNYFKRYAYTGFYDVEKIFTLYYCKDAAEFNQGKLPTTEDVESSYIDTDGIIYFVQPTTADQIAFINTVEQAAMFGLARAIIRNEYAASPLEEWLEFGFASVQAGLTLESDYLKQQVQSLGRIPDIWELNDWYNITQFDKYAFAQTVAEFFDRMNFTGIVKKINFNQGTINIGLSAIADQAEFNEVWHRNIDLFYLRDNRIKLQTESENFITYAADSDQNYAIEYTDLLEETNIRYSENMDCGIDQKVYMYIFPSLCDFHYSEGRDYCDQNIIGMGRGIDKFLVVTPNDLPRTPEQMEGLVMHEFAHVFHANITGAFWAYWLIEGFAVFMPGGIKSQEDIDRMRPQMIAEFDDMLNQAGRYPGVDDLGNMQIIEQYDLDYYLIGGAMVDFIVKTHGYVALREFMRLGGWDFSPLGYASKQDFESAWFAFYEETYRSSDNSNKVAAKKTMSPINVDGIINENAWDLSILLEKEIFGTQNNTINFGVLWDDQYLYVAANVNDADLVNDGGANYTNDGVEIYIDANFNKGTSYDSYDRQFRKTYGYNGLEEINGSTNGVLHALNVREGGYAVELAIPWTNLNISGGANTKIGFDIANNDDDDGGSRESQIVWCGTGDNWKNTSAFGELTLSSDTVENGNIYSIEISESWNLLSVPVKSNDMTKATLFPNSISSAFLFDNGYKVADTLKVGKGYWLKFNNDRVTEISGIKSSQDIIDVVQGWNMIGSSHSELSTSNISSDPAGLVISNYFEFNNGYVIADTLKPGKGYWIKTNGQGYLYYDETRSNKITPIDFSKLPVVIVSDKNSCTGNLYLSDDQSVIRKSELPPTPPMDIFDVRYSDNRYVKQLADNTNYLQISGAEYPIRIRISGVDVRVKDVIDGRILNILVEDGGKVVINNKNINRIQIEPVELPIEYTLYQNYPNPFNPSTMIKYGIPEDAKVKIDIFNSIGQKVRTVVDTQMEAGYHEIQLNANELASGVYFYRIHAGNFIDTKKMLLIK